MYLKSALLRSYRSFHFICREFFASNPFLSSKARALELMERLRELGARVGPAGMFDREVDSVIQDHTLRVGVKAEEVEDFNKFKEAARLLSQKLTLDPSLTLM